MKNKIARRIIAAVTIVITALLPAVASADGLKQFMLRGYIFENNLNYAGIDSVSVTSLTLNDTVPVSFRLLSGNDSTRLNRGAELRALVDGGMGNYTIVLEKEGYEPLVKNFRVASVSQDIFYIRDLTMKRESTRKLDEVTVSATRIKMVMRGDTMVFDAGAFKFEQGSMLDALVRQLPGTTLDADGVITVNGRKVNELLLNGNDFFSGDPKVALQNLPAYTVKDIKVYDKAAKDAYLTHSDARLTRREEDENIVMDVNLKKEYNDGYLANAEAGYGTHDRYLGRAFGLAYTPKFRLSAFVNANNIGDQTQGGTSGQWRGSTSNENGIQKLFKTGIDYVALMDRDDMEVWGNFVYTRDRYDNRSISATTSFYPDRDLYGRADTRNSQLTHSLSFNPSFRLMLDHFFATFQPAIRYSKTERDNFGRSATFTESPDEAFRGEALDSVFAARADGSFSRYMLTRLMRMSAGEGDNINGRFWTNGTIRPASWKGSLSFNMTANLSRSTDDNRQIYSQIYGPQSDATGRPVDSDRFTGAKSHSRSIDGGIGYSRDHRRFGEVHTTNIRYSIGINGSHNHSDGDTRLYSDTILPDPLTPPSAVIGQLMALDPANSPYTVSNNSGGNASASFSYSRDATAPGDSTANLGFSVRINLSYDLNDESYSLTKPGEERRSIDRTTGFFAPHISIQLSSPNKVRNMNGSLYYYVSTSAPSMAMLLGDVSTSNPLDIVINGADGLRNTVTHNVGFNFMRIARNQSNAQFLINAGWKVVTDATAYSVSYDPATGVTTRRPDNISGNWEASLNPSYSFSAGSRGQTSLRFSLGNSVQNSADYVAINSTPRRSSVLSLNINPNVSLDYTTTGGSSFSTGITTTIAHQESERENFNNRTWYEIWPYVRAMVKLPASLELNTQFNPYFRRGYSDPTMNTSEYVWDATLVKTFGRPAITLKLSAHDILGSAKHVYTSVNAQGRTETWRYTLPRYVMLTVGYRFDMKPRSEREPR